MGRTFWRAFGAFFARLREHRLLIALDHLLHHEGGGDAGQVGAAGGGGEREAEADEIVGRVADDGLVEVADLDFDLAVGVGDGAEVADVAVPADPDGWTLGKLCGRVCFEPLVELKRASTYVGVGGASHLQAASFFQNSETVCWFDFNYFFRHQQCLMQEMHKWFVFWLLNRPRRNSAATNEDKYRDPSPFDYAQGQDDDIRTLASG